MRLTASPTANPCWWRLLGEDRVIPIHLASLRPLSCVIARSERSKGRSNPGGIRYGAGLLYLGICRVRPWIASSFDRPEAVLLLAMTRERSALLLYSLAIAWILFNFLQKFFGKVRSVACVFIKILPYHHNIRVVEYHALHLAQGIASGNGDEHVLGTFYAAYLV